MNRRHGLGFSWVLLCVGALGVAGLAARPAPATERSVYVTVVDNQGAAVADLTTADFTLKEGGRDRVITTVELAKAPLQIALAVEASLTPLGAVRQGLLDFMQRVASRGQVELVVVGQSNRVAVPATSDVPTMLAGINALPLNQLQGLVTHVPEGVADLARGFFKSRPERPVIVMIAVDSQQASNEEPQNVLNLLKDSNALFHVVSITGGGLSGSAAQMMETAGRAQVLGDGPKQTGGRQWPITALTAIPKTLQQVAGELTNQYKITYTLPDGQKASDRLQVTTKRRGVTLRSPSRISDKF
jgi:VWFA-related protein